MNTVVLCAALAAATGFALGRATGPTGESRAALPPVGEAPEPTRPPTTPPPEPTPPPALTPPTAPSEAASVAWSKPAAWQDAPNPNSMRLATYKVADNTETTVSRAGGALDANIDRWASQFGEQGKSSLQRESRTINGFRVTVVTTSGSNYTAMSGETKNGEVWMLLAAVVEDPRGGDQAYFFKMTGPKKNVDAARKDFDALLSSLRKPS